MCASSRSRSASAARRAAVDTKAETSAATDMNTSSDTRFSVSPMRSVWYGGMRNQLTSSGAATAAARPGPRPPTAAMRATASSWSDIAVETDTWSRMATSTAVSATSSAAPPTKPATRRPCEIGESRDHGQRVGPARASGRGTTWTSMSPARASTSVTTDPPAGGASARSAWPRARAGRHPRRERTTPARRRSRPTRPLGSRRRARRRAGGGRPACEGPRRRPAGGPGRRRAGRASAAPAGPPGARRRRCRRRRSPRRRPARGRGGRRPGRRPGGRRATTTASAAQGGVGRSVVQRHVGGGAPEAPRPGRCGRASSLGSRRRARSRRSRAARPARDRERDAGDRAGGVGQRRDLGDRQRRDHVDTGVQQCARPRRPGGRPSGSRPPTSSTRATSGRAASTAATSSAAGGAGVSRRAIASVTARPWASRQAEHDGGAVTAPTQPLGEHGVGCADAGRRADVDPQLPSAPRRHCGGATGGRDAVGAAPSGGDGGA